MSRAIPAARHAQAALRVEQARTNACVQADGDSHLKERIQPRLLSLHLKARHLREPGELSQLQLEHHARSLLKR